MEIYRWFLWFCLCLILFIWGELITDLWHFGPFLGWRPPTRLRWRWRWMGQRNPNHQLVDGLADHHPIFYRVLLVPNRSQLVQDFVGPSTVFLDQPCIRSFFQPASAWIWPGPRLIAQVLIFLVMSPFGPTLYPRSALLGCWIPVDDSALVIEPLPSGNLT